MKRIFGCIVLIGLVATGCDKKAAGPARAGMQAMPVQTVAVTVVPVAQSNEYVATIKSRRSATLQPQVSGLITRILVHSGDHVKTGQVLMEIDPRQQLATVAAARATELQEKALYDYNAVEVERQRKLFEAGVTSRESYDQERQAYGNAKAAYESAVETRKAQEEQLAFYSVRAPFDGVVGDVPVHVGDYASPLAYTPTSTPTVLILTTVDENKDLEAYIYVPTERAAQLHMGQAVDLLDNSGKLLETTKIYFISPQVDSTLQGILVKAPVHRASEMLRAAQMVKAKVIWSTPLMAVVPVLAVVRQNGQTFVYVAQRQDGHYFAREVAVTLGETVGNQYSVSEGLKAGDRVIVSGTQFLVNNMPVVPMGS